MNAPAIRNLPILATVIVALAVAAMMGLGIWQLARGTEKRAAIAQIAANRDLPEMSFPNPPVGDQHLFRHAGLFCLEVVGWREQVGRDASGKTGWRHLAECRIAAEGMTVTVDVGVTRAPGVVPRWTGGPVTGVITHAPNSTPFIAALFKKPVPRNLMLVAKWGGAGGLNLPGLSPSAEPDPASVPNNHLSYAVQWFLFAGVALVIYLLALLRRKQLRRSAQTVIQNSQPES